MTSSPGTGPNKAPYACGACSPSAGGAAQVSPGRKAAEHVIEAIQAPEAQHKLA